MSTSSIRILSLQGPQIDSFLSSLLHAVFLPVMKLGARLAHGTVFYYLLVISVSKSISDTVLLVRIAVS